MATATDLLPRAMSADSNVLLIDHYSRVIKIPESITCLGVENDDEVLRLNFRMPRYLDKTDLSKFPVRINYLNAKGEDDVYDVDDLAIVGDNLTFTWLVGPTATRYKGNTTFNVCMKIVDSSGYIQNEYNTTVASLPVLEGLECEESVIEQYTDILEQWKNQLFGIGDTEETKLHAKSIEEQQNITNKGNEVLDSIPEDYTTTYKLANAASRTKAPAIVGAAEGKMIALHDSSDDYVREFKLYGKAEQVHTTGRQLFDHASIEPNLYTRVAADGTITVECDNSTGEAGKYATFYTPTSSLLLPSTSYTIVLEVLSTSGVGENVYLASHYSDELSQFADSPSINNLAVKTYIKVATTLDTFADSVYMCRGFMTIPAGTKVKSVFRVSVVYGPAPNPFVYEPFSGGFPSPSPDWPQRITSFQNSAVYVSSKNLLNITTGGTALGVTETVSNGLVSFSGTSNGNGGRTLWHRSDTITLMPGTYTFSMNVPSGTAPQHCLSRIDTAAIVANGDSTFVVTELVSVYLGFNYLSDITYDAKNVSVQLEFGDVASDHVLGKTLKYIKCPLPVEFFAGELNALAGTLAYAKLGNVPISGWSPGKTSSGWVHGADSSEGETVPFHYHLGNANEFYYNHDTICSHFPAAKTWTEIVSGKTEMAYQGNANDLAFIAIRIKRSRLANYGFLNNGDADSAKNAFEAWLNAMANANIPVKMVGSVSSIASIEPIEFTTYATDTVIYNDHDAPMYVEYNCDTKTYINNIVKSNIAEIMEEIRNGSY